MLEQIIRDGLVVRSLTDEYREPLAQFYHEMFGQENPDEDIKGWVSDLTSGQHPTVTADDVWMVIDPAHENRIVSALLLIPQVWRYEGLRLPVGRIELVATHPDYRKRGLVRILMNIAHERCETLGINVQAITGIPHYYRQFGYTMGIALGGSAFLPLANIPDRKEPQYTLQPATPDDIPHMMEWYQRYADQSLFTVERTAERWAFELKRRPRTVATTNYFVINNADGRGVGYVGLWDLIETNRLSCIEYALSNQTSYLATFDDVIYAIKTFAQSHYTDTSSIVLRFDSGLHPSIGMILNKVLGGYTREILYAWYIRAASPAKFIQEIAPVLERRLEGSAAHRYSGELAIDFYDKTGLVMTFEDGKLLKVEDNLADNISAGFGFQTFLHLVCGYHSLAELQRILPDTIADKTATVLLDALFPKKPSWIIAIL